VFKVKGKMSGSVLIIGGGIAGMAASLDLADMGYKTYIIEKTPSIGGTMSQLDKTFPTLDCAMCTMAPRMVDISRHPNIEIIPYAEVEEVDGDIGKLQREDKKDDEQGER
jgi:Heterodisulfide reductase, subunit A and related polyferredoxins